MQEGRCPRCGSYNLIYKDLCLCNGAMYYPWECENCHSKGREWYDIAFSDQEITEEGAEF